MLRYLPFLLLLAVWVYAFIDCLNTPENEVRKLPKVVWAIVILLFGQVLVGPVAWFAVGRPRRNAPYGAVKPQERQWVAPDDNPDFLKSLGKDGTDGPGPGEETPRQETPGQQMPRQGEPRQEESAQEQPAREEPVRDEASDLRRWESDLQRREDDLRRRENGHGGGPEDPPK